MKNICIVRNSEAKSNAGLLRIVDASLFPDLKPITLTRNRNVTNNQIIRKDFSFKGDNIPNYEIQLSSEMGSGLNNIFNLLHYQFKTFRWLYKNTEKYDYIHAFDLDAGLPSYLASLLKNKKFIYHIADFYADSRQGIPNTLRNLIIKLEYHIISKAYATIICTDKRKRQIKGSKPNKLLVIHNSPLEIVFDSVTEDTVEDEISLGYVGGLSDLRFINELLDFVSINTEIKLNIAGFGKLEQKVKEYSIKYENINFLGRLDYDEALKLYNQSTLMIAVYDPSHPNHKYSAPNKVYEAMFLGKPIIVAKNTGVDDIVTKEQMGLVIDYSVESLDSAIKYLESNKNKIKDYGSNAQRSYAQYSWQTMKKHLNNLYSELLRSES